MSNELSALLEEVRGRARVYDFLQQELQELDDALAQAQAQQECTVRAADIVRTVARATQEQFVFRVSEIVSAALDAVFPDPYRFGIDFVEKRGTIEAEMFLERDGQRFSLMDAAGGGVVDVVSLALRIAVWVLSSPRRRNVLILDEPLRFLSADLQASASALLRRISEELGLQIIMVSHEEEIIARADRVFRVVHTGEGSVVRSEEVARITEQKEQKTRKRRRRK